MDELKLIRFGVVSALEILTALCRVSRQQDLVEECEKVLKEFRVEHGKNNGDGG